MKKAMELSVLCECEIAVMVFNPQNKLFLYCSSEMDQILNKFASACKEPHEVRSNQDLLLQHFGEQLAKQALAKKGTVARREPSGTGGGGDARDADADEGAAEGEDAGAGGGAGAGPSPAKRARTGPRAAGGRGDDARPDDDDDDDSDADADGAARAIRAEPVLPGHDPVVVEDLDVAAREVFGPVGLEINPNAHATSPKAERAVHFLVQEFQALEDWARSQPAPQVPSMNQATLSVQSQGVQGGAGSMPPPAGGGLKARKGLQGGLTVAIPPNKGKSILPVAAMPSATGSAGHVSLFTPTNPPSVTGLLSVKGGAGGAPRDLHAVGSGVGPSANAGPGISNMGREAALRAAAGAGADVPSASALAAIGEWRRPPARQADRPGAGGPGRRPPSPHTHRNTPLPAPNPRSRGQGQHLWRHGGERGGRGHAGGRGAAALGAGLRPGLVPWRRVHAGGSERPVGVASGGEGGNGGQGEGEGPGGGGAGGEADLAPGKPSEWACAGARRARGGAGALGGRGAGLTLTAIPPCLSRRRASGRPRAEGSRRGGRGLGVLTGMTY